MLSDLSSCYSARKREWRTATQKRDGSPWSPTMSPSLHKHAIYHSWQNKQEDGGGEMEWGNLESMWHPPAAWFLFLLRIICLYNLRLNTLSQERKGPGSGLMIFISTDNFVIGFVNILGTLLSLSHAQKQTFLPHFTFIFISSSALPLYPPSFFLFCVPSTEYGYLRQTIGTEELVEHFLNISFELF